ncbi:hypothetical protein JOM56_014055 [Amanita muscaria]
MTGSRAVQVCYLARGLYDGHVRRNGVLESKVPGSKHMITDLLRERAYTIHGFCRTRETVSVLRTRLNSIQWLKRPPIYLAGLHPNSEAKRSHAVPRDSNSGHDLLYRLVESALYKIFQLKTIKQKEEETPLHLRNPSSNRVLAMCVACSSSPGNHSRCQSMAGRSGAVLCAPADSRRSPPFPRTLRYLSDGANQETKEIHSLSPDHAEKWVQIGPD